MNEQKKSGLRPAPAPAVCCFGLLRDGLGTAFAAPGFKLRRKAENCRRRRAEQCLSPVRRDILPEAEDIARAVAALESEAVRRALSGVAVPVFHQGRECGSTVKHSDQLLMFLLKTLNPERFGAGKEAPRQARRAFALEIDLSAAGEADAGEAEDDDGGTDEDDCGQ